MTAAILEKINDLPEHLQDDVENYIDFLIQKQSKNTVSLSHQDKKDLDLRMENHNANPSESLTISELKEKMNLKYGI